MFTYVNISIYIYIYMFMYVYICVYVCICLDMQIYVDRQKDRQIYIYLCMFTYVDIYIYMCVCIHKIFMIRKLFTYVCLCLQMFAYICKYIYKQIDRYFIHFIFTSKQYTQTQYLENTRVICKGRVLDPIPQPGLCGWFQSSTAMSWSCCGSRRMFVCCESCSSEVNHTSVALPPNVYSNFPDRDVKGNIGKISWYHHCTTKILAWPLQPGCRPSP